jgi:hypothetical protein
VQTTITRHPERTIKRSNYHGLERRCKTWNMSSRKVLS